MKATAIDSARYGRCLHHAQKVNWSIDIDVIRFRQLEATDKFMPDSLSLVGELHFLSAEQQCFFSQVQGRTYAGLRGVADRCINAKVLELSREHSLGDQTALAALLYFSQEQLKHQELFRRIERLAAATMPAGYTMTADPDTVARAVLSKSTWAVLALACSIEILTQVHYVHSIKDGRKLSPLFKDTFYYHWLEELQHATLDEIEWQRVHDRMTCKTIDTAVSDFIELTHTLDDILQTQAAADGRYFCNTTGLGVESERCAAVNACFLRAYRLQYIESGLEIERFQKALASKVSTAQLARIHSALAPLLAATLQIQRECAEDPTRLSLCAPPPSVF